MGILCWIVIGLLFQELAEDKRDEAVNTDHAPKFKNNWYLADVFLHEELEGIDHRHPELKYISKWIFIYVVKE